MGKENGCQCCELVGVETGNSLQKKKVHQTDHLPIQILATPIYLPIYDSLRTSEHPSLSKSLTPQIIKPAPGIRFGGVLPGYNYISGKVVWANLGFGVTDMLTVGILVKEAEK